MRKSLQNLYENMLITEVVGALNYWLTPNGDFIKVDHHLGYAQKNFKIDKWPEYTQGVGWAQFESELYGTVYKLGYIRVVEQPATIYFTYSRAKTPNKAQASALFNLATDKQKNLVDGETQKTLVKNNEIDVDIVRNDALYKAEKELKPDFYKKRKDYGEGFSKLELDDYTKLIYEYNIKGEVDSPDNTNDYRKDIPNPEPLPKNKEDDYRQATIGDAIDGIKQAHEGKGMFDLKNTVQYWKDHLHIKGFSDEEIRQIIEMGLGYHDKVRKNPYKENTFSKYELNDYTKVIYEAHTFTDPDKRTVFKDAVSSIANAIEENMGYVTDEVMTKVHYWRKIMFQKGFSSEEVKRVMNKALGRE